MRVLNEEKFSYYLLEDELDGAWYLTFMSGGVFEVDICVRLVGEEIEKIKRDQGNIKKLVRSFMDDRSLYFDRRVIPSKRPDKKNTA